MSDRHLPQRFLPRRLRVGRIDLDPVVRTAFSVALTGAQLAGRVTGAVLAPLSEDERYAQFRRELAGILRDALGVPELIAEAYGVGAPVRYARAALEPVPPDDELVRRRFNDLLARSSDVHAEEGEPALVNVVKQLAPDEARILRVLHEERAVPYADLLRVSMVGAGAEVLLPHLSMVAERAGCRAPARSAFYLANLDRLGLVEFVPTALDGHGDYGLLEGRPDYIAAAKPAREDRTARPKMRKGHIRLSPLGERLTELVFDVGTEAE